VPSARSEGGFRLYSPGDVDRLLLVKAMKPLKLTIGEMRELADLLAPTAAPSSKRSARLVDFDRRAVEAIDSLNKHLDEAKGLRKQIAAAKRGN
jgi:MerR family transcriptional regulator, copper efflux regulator